MFEGKSAPVLVAWMPAGLTDKTLSFTGDLEVTDALGVATVPLKAGQSPQVCEADVADPGRLKATCIAAEIRLPFDPDLIFRPNKFVNSYRETTLHCLTFGARIR